MSFQSTLSSLNSPPLIAAAGTIVLAAIPVASEQAALLPLVALQAANITAFAVNVAAVSVPGRLDDAGRREAGYKMPEKQSSEDEQIEEIHAQAFSPTRGRTLVAPAGWAFAIWGPIYLGELVFTGAVQFLDKEVVHLALPQIAVPFCAANLVQACWCASFRPKYNQGWHKYISVGMLGGTALALSKVHAVTTSTPGLALYVLPMTMHFGWTTAATLVNLSGSIAMDPKTSDRAVIATGHASAVLATALGLGVTIVRNSPTYGLTVAWALAACASGMMKENKKSNEGDSDALATGRSVQQALCWAGSALCAAVSLSQLLLPAPSSE